LGSSYEFDREIEGSVQLFTVGIWKVQFPWPSNQNHLITEKLSSNNRTVPRRLHIKIHTIQAVHLIILAKQTSKETAHLKRQRMATGPVPSYFSTFIP
jgi:hypothetical protein